MASLTQRSAHAALWNYAGNTARLLLQFTIGVILARLLGPQAFGLVAIAMLLIGLGQLFVDFGFNSAIIQSREIARGDVDFVFTMQIAIGAAMTGLVLVAAGPIAGFFGEPAAAPVVGAMAWMFVLRAIGQTAAALLGRELRFKALQLGAIISYLVGYAAIGLPMAFYGYGVWSLVAAQLVQTGMSTVIAVFMVGGLHRFSLRGGRGDLFRFGGLVISANISSWFLSNSDALIVGHVNGATPLGFYNRAQNLAGVPMGAVVGGMQGVLFASASRAQDNHEALRSGLLACVGLFVLLSGSVLLAVAAASDTVILALYGKQWEQTAALLTPLCVAMAINGILAFIGPVLMGIGRVDKEVKAQWLSVLMMVPAIYGVAHISLVAMAWTVVLVYFIRMCLLSYALQSSVQFGWKEVAQAIIAPLIVAVAAAVSARLADYSAGSLSVGWRLLFVITAAGLGSAFAAFCLRGSLMRSALGALILKSDVIPVPFCRWLTPRG
ncbi:MAG: lipopolysaccharide biosynthesis protein [Pseudomonadota bacterium]